MAGEWIRECILTYVDKRPPWPQRFVLVAEVWEQFSTCLHRHVGAAIFQPKSHALMGVGYNDTPIGEIDCAAGGCIPCQNENPTSLRLDCKCVHAEANAVFLNSRHGSPGLEGCWIATTYQSCDSCVKMYRQVGITHMVGVSGMVAVSDRS